MCLLHIYFYYFSLTVISLLFSYLIHLFQYVIIETLYITECNMYYESTLYVLEQGQV